MGSDDEDHTTAVYGEEDLDEEDDEESEEDHHALNNQQVDVDDVDMIEDDDDEEEEDDSMSSAAGEVTIAVAGIPSVATTVAAATPTTPATATTPSIVRLDAIVEVKKPMPLDDSRRLFQRLWTDEDEIELLQGFLDYSTQRGTNNSSHHHHDTAAFYDQIKARRRKWQGLESDQNRVQSKLKRITISSNNMAKVQQGWELLQILLILQPPIWLKKRLRVVYCHCLRNWLTIRMGLVEVQGG